MRISFVILFILLSFSVTADENEDFYKNRYNFIQEYISELKKLKSSNSKYKGAVAESLSGSFFSVFEKKSQSEIDDMAINLCKKKNNKGCKVRFQSLNVNPNYNRFATYNSLEKKLNVGIYEIPSSIILTHQGITFIKATSNHDEKNFSCTASSMKNDFIIDIIISQIELYPRTFLDKAGLKYIMICDNITVNGAAGPEGLAPSHYDQSPGVFFLSVTKIKKQIDAGRPEIIKHVFHHEFYHVIDSTLTKAVIDNEWKQINQNPYSSSAIKANIKGLLKDQKGFVSDYAKNNEFEDKAEVFAYLITRNKDMRVVLASDVILYNKAKLMIERMKSISTDINESFWSKLLL